MPTLTSKQLAMKQARAIKHRKNKKQAVMTLCGHLRQMIREA
jgi:hypothetical protein